MNTLPEAEKPRVAVIMRSKNEMPYVRPALEMLCKQTFRDFELFVVDSGSTDGSIEVFREYIDEEHLIQIAPEDYVPGLVLNRAIEATDHEIIMLLNADAVPMTEDCLEKLLAPIINGEEDATLSVQVARNDAHFIVKYDYQRGYDPKNIKGDNADFFSAVACAFKRVLWEKHQFRTHGYSEDVAWSNVCRADGFRFKLVQDSLVEHSHNYSLKGLYRKRFRHGLTFSEIYNQKPNLAKQLYLCAREIVRDFLYALRKLQLHTIPYNIAYRCAIHAGYHMGLATGWKERGSTARFDQLEKPE